MGGASDATLDEVISNIGKKAFQPSCELLRLIPPPHHLLFAVCYALFTITIACHYR
jgi:hypothetical protein